MRNNIAIVPALALLTVRVCHVEFLLDELHFPQVATFYHSKYAEKKGKRERKCAGVRVSARAGENWRSNEASAPECRMGARSGASAPERRERSRYAHSPLLFGLQPYRRTCESVRGC